MIELLQSYRCMTVVVNLYRKGLKIEEIRAIRVQLAWCLHDGF